MAEHYCRFNMGYRVNRGAFKGVSLNGIKFWVAGDLGADFSKGAEWAELTFEPGVTKPQRDAIATILPHTYPVTWKAFTMGEDAPVEWTATTDRAVARLERGQGRRGCPQPRADRHGAEGTGRDQKPEVFRRAAQHGFHPDAERSECVPRRREAVRIQRLERVHDHVQHHGKRRQDGVRFCGEPEAGKLGGLEKRPFESSTLPAPWLPGFPGFASNRLHRLVWRLKRRRASAARRRRGRLYGVGPDAGGGVPVDFDALMQKVVARRDDNWKQLQQYVLEEHYLIDVRGASNTRIWAERREYFWFPRDGFFIRSPLKVNGVTVSKARSATQAEDQHLRWVRAKDQADPKTIDTRSSISIGSQGIRFTPGQSGTTSRRLTRRSDGFHPAAAPAGLRRIRVTSCGCPSTAAAMRSSAASRSRESRSSGSSTTRSGSSRATTTATRRSRDASAWKTRCGRRS